ncbi:hypothetical protein N7U62_01990 [Reichenbachiella sp. ABR2-5]|uniref:Alpha-galactosidase n=1 Tax=Reichenbachiella ulvae TaxID=2980104 RepID=A0ABT3CPB1_9BACT|nr:hypothetical protein [Reichenbachiella ulvae]MCV9385411.1 hypothetical protein [Reichenbachiella ulvae]
MQKKGFKNIGVDAIWHSLEDQIREYGSWIAIQLLVLTQYQWNNVWNEKRYGCDNNDICRTESSHLTPHGYVLHQLHVL